MGSVQQAVNTVYGLDDKIKVNSIVLICTDPFHAKLIKYKELEFLNTSLKALSRVDWADCISRLSISA